MLISASNSNKIRNMSLICAVLVACIHVHWAPVGVSKWMDVVFAQGIARMAVPFFFIVSGFFIGVRIGEPNWYRTALAKRIKTLLVPYLLWSLLFLIFCAFVNFIANIRAGQSMLNALRVDLRILPSAFGLELSCHPNVVPLWYVRNLIFLVIASPMLWWLVRHLGLVWIIFCFVALYANVGSIGWWANFFAHGYFSLAGMLYFSVGLRLADGFRISARKQKALFWLSTTVVVVSMVAKCVVGEWFNAWHLMTLTIPFLIYSTWVIIPGGQWPQWLVNCSFPIYVMHWIILQALGLLNIPKVWAWETCFWIVCCVVPILVAALCRQFCPRVGSWLFGGRL